jgi:hypothetical protein
VCVCVCARWQSISMYLLQEDTFFHLCVCVFGNTNFSYLHDTDSLNMLSSYIYTYMLITTIRVYTYVIQLHSINKLSETLQTSLHHVTILLSQQLTNWRLVSSEPFIYPHITCTSSSRMAKINIYLWNFMW